jgi:hypothetical protein
MPTYVPPVWAIVLGLVLLAGCGATERAASKDPMRCERDPSCAKARGSYADCNKQCSDDPECVDRCRQMQTDRLGQPQ